MSVKRGFILILFLLLWRCPVMAQKSHDIPEVLVVGTIHGMHAENPNYTYHDIVRILATYKPDAICVEIPPSYFRKKSYLKEMTLACIYGGEHNIKSYPIDYWGVNYDVRAARREYMQTEDYKNKKRVEDSSLQNSSVIQSFEKKYGSIDTVWRSKAAGYEFFNGKDYNDYTREAYRIEIAVYGDGVMNLHSEARNAKMLSLIDSAITVSQAKRVIVFTGAEHKYYFDDALAKRNSVRLVALNDILPLQDVSPSRNETDYLEHWLARDYYLDTNEMYANAFVPLLHGPEMDLKPELISAKDIELSERLMQEWASLQTRSARYDFERLWLDFLQARYADGVEVGKRLQPHIDEFGTWFFPVLYWRNLGFCYDMLGMRNEAVQSYTQGEETAKTLGCGEETVRAIFKDYTKNPYKRQ